MLNAKQNSKKAFYKKVNSTLLWLQTTFPNTFAKANTSRSPLKIGIHQDLKSYLKDTNSLLPYSDIRKALGAYINHYQYQSALFPGKARLDLTGNAAGEVTEEEAKAAKEKIILLKKKFKEKKEDKTQIIVKQAESLP